MCGLVKRLLASPVFIDQYLHHKTEPAVMERAKTNEQTPQHHLRYGIMQYGMLIID